ncbi:AraC family transcriptional regulator [Corallococcus exercitus]|uniref:AraC family transcriptional regulator n=1 Tax=Corallococcus exercitus TaxID=2316736 RepID=A0A7Y4JUJ6_9BACT|nr:AraC family transcriptional regulator [Corallococcus exercitus]NOK10442.1 AraC family transcriptional regulator [Corallococcus exercitus]
MTFRRSCMSALLLALWAPLAAAQTPSTAASASTTALASTSAATPEATAQKPGAAPAATGSTGPALKSGAAPMTTASVAPSSTPPGAAAAPATPPTASGGMPAAPGATRAKLPQGWYVTESAPQHYEAGVDETAPCEGTRSAFLRSRTQATDSFGTFMQAFSAQDFRGKRLRFSAAVRHQDVKGWAGLWMRVEGADPKQPLAFDNMQSRALVGTHGCKRYDVVLDVPLEATTIMAGLIMSGTGQAWLGGVRFEPVDASVKTTDLLATLQPLPSGPQGLEEAPRPQGGANAPLGRVGTAWFDTQRVQTATPLVRGKGPTWKGEFDDELFEHGIEVNGVYERRDLAVKVRAGGAATLIEGTWGGEPLSIRLASDSLRIRWGTDEQRFERDLGASTPKGCNAYLQKTGRFEGQWLEVCGVALATRPPLTQLVAAFLSGGVRAGASRGPIPPPRLPVRSPQPYDSSGRDVPSSQLQ